MVKYFRIALTTAMLGAIAVPAFAQSAPATPPGEMAPSAPDAAKPDAVKPQAPVKKAKIVRKHHVAAVHQTAKTAPAPSN